MSTPTVPVDALNKLMAVTASPDLSQGLAAGTGALGFVQTANGPVPIVASINDCLTKLALSLTRVSTFATDDDHALQQVLNVMEKPFDELGTALAELLLPDPNAIDSSTLGNALSDVASQVKDALLNPFQSILQQQGAAIDSSFDQIRKVLFSGQNPNGFFIDYFNQSKTAVKTLFMDPKHTDANLVSIFIYAFEYGIPAIDAELAYLKAMKTALNGVIEESSKLPTSIDFKLPNSSVVQKLCDAEVQLQEIATRLRTGAVFDRTKFNRATDDICSAQQMIFDGKFDMDLLKTHSANFLGVAGIKNKDLSSLRFLPNILFKLQLQELATLGNLYTAQEFAVTELYNNIIDSSASIEALASSTSGDIIALLVDVLHRQISSLRIELQMQGGDGAPDSSLVIPNQQTLVQTQITTDGLSNTQAKQAIATRFAGFSQYDAPAPQQKPDISTYLSSQAATYLMLTTLCQLMQRAKLIYGGIDAIINFETRLMKALQKLTLQFNISNCGNPESGVAVTNSLNAFLQAARDRLNTTGHCNEPLRRAATTLRRAINAREEFLSCMRNDMSFGSSTLNALMNATTQGVALVNNLKQMVRQFPDIEKEVKALNLRGLLGVEGQEYSALEALLQSIQCLLLNCNNPLVQSVGEDLLSSFQQQLSRRNSKVVTMASLDQIPLVAANARLQNRAGQIGRVLDAVRAVLNLDVSSLCGTGNPDDQRALNTQRTTDSGAAFGATPITAVAPRNSQNPNVAPSLAVQQLQQSIVVNMQFFQAPTTATPAAPVAFADDNGASSFTQ